jgi:hypothetical protein
MSAVFATPQRLELLPAEVRPRLAELEAAAEDYQQALAAFTAEANDLGGPHLADLSPEVRREVDLMADLLNQVETLILELHHLDSEATAAFGAIVPPIHSPLPWQVAPLLERHRDAAESAGVGAYAGWQAVQSVNGRSGLLVNLGRMGRHGHGVADAVTRLHGAEVARVRDLPHYQAHTSVDAYNQRVATHHGAMDRSANAARADLRREWRAFQRLENPVTRAGQRLAESRAGQLLGSASRRIGWGGAAFGVGETLAHALDGDYTKAGMRGLQTAGGAMMLFPPTAAAGTVIVVTTTAWEHREAIADGTRWLGDKVDQGVRNAGSAVTEGARAAGSAISSGARDMLEGARRLNPFG